MLSEYSIGLLESRCPRLRAIDIHVLSDSINSGRLLRFFETCNSLTRIYIDWSTNHPIDDRVLAHLAGRDGQLGFGTQSPIKYSTISKAFEIILSPFKDIHTLDVRVQSKAVAPLVAAIKSAARLELGVLDNKVMVLPAVSSLAGLIELEVSFQVDVELQADDTLALRSLKHLTKFSLEALGVKLSSHTFSDYDSLHLFEGMSNLKHLEFQVVRDMSINALITLGIHCRQLRYVRSGENGSTCWIWYT